jgi:deoxyribonuclease V
MTGSRGGERPYSARVRAAIALQKELAGGFEERGWPEGVRYVGGADIAFARGADGSRAGKVGSPAIGIAVVWDLQQRRAVEGVYVRSVVEFPYVPGLLSFREEPILSAAMDRIRHKVDAWIFDGQGRAHPRGVGLATHMGIRRGIASIGAAKSVLIGRYEMPAAVKAVLGKKKRPVGEPGWMRVMAGLMHEEREIARAVWMKPRKEPVIVSQGQHCTLEQAVQTVIAATEPGEWLPEPTRLADELSKRTRELDEGEAVRLVRETIALSAG